MNVAILFIAAAVSGGPDYGLCDVTVDYSMGVVVGVDTHPAVVVRVPRRAVAMSCAGGICDVAAVRQVRVERSVLVRRTLFLRERQTIRRAIQWRPLRRLFGRCR